jgi:hypothetical protein
MAVGVLQANRPKKVGMVDVTETDRSWSPPPISSEEKW